MTRADRLVRVSFVLIAQVEPADDKRAIRERVAAHLADPAITRLIVAPGHPESGGDVPDAYLAQVIAALMIDERLDVEVAYVAPFATEAVARYDLPHGPDAEGLAQLGTAREVPLIRDDAATVLVGYARHLGGGGAKLHGETYVDSERLFTGQTRGIRIEPTISEPGLRARVDSPIRIGRWINPWHTGRAAQTGGTNIVVEREGVLTPRELKRSTFYRHHVDLKLVLR